jgi:predicted transcriptional regulator of viral defense system
MTTEAKSASFDRAKSVFDQHHGVLRTQVALDAGIHPRTLYAMRDAGVIEQLSRGLYRLATAPPLGNPDLVTVAAKVPQGVLCLISALSYHGITTQIPHEIYVAIVRQSERPRLDYPPMRLFWFGTKAFTSGVETHDVDGVTLRVYSVEKTLADCFKYRNKIGLDTALEALRLYRERKPVKADDIVRYAEICRVRKVMRPYLESIL